MDGKGKEAVVQQKSLLKYGHGIAWFRGAMIGKEDFGRVYLATLNNPKSKYSYFPSVMAVKSTEVSVSGSIQKKMKVFSNVKCFPNIIRCFGEETTIGKNDMMVYNLLLEYGCGGTLVDRIKKLYHNGLPESKVRVYARVDENVENLNRLIVEKSYFIASPAKMPIPDDNKITDIKNISGLHHMLQDATSSLLAIVIGPPAETFFKCSTYDLMKGTTPIYAPFIVKSLNREEIFIIKSEAKKDKMILGKCSNARQKLTRNA
ncbi:Mitogen-activated protein kinase kinase kinase YODA-like [Forsythia ovata]|uniref:Mitogen-activated protein kinase kinase kinase YODA-like n=1 Tax=Forsythia ovata TaxID=205694 RepID=A0ABD1RK87_9LAMI